jgi:hypothetical protein
MKSKSTNQRERKKEKKKERKKERKKDHWRSFFQEVVKFCALKNRLRKP